MTSLTLVRRIAARPSIVFEALTTPEGIAQWWGPDAGPVLMAETDVRIGGAAPGEANEIAGQRLAGISVSNTYSGVRIERNSIHDNGSLGIDLLTDGFVTGVTPNDPLDLDTGGNGLQNY